RHARGEEFQLDPISKEVFAIGFVMGAGMGLGGDVISGIVNTSKDGMSAQQRREFDESIARFKEEGINQSESELRALDEFMQTSEGEKIVNEAIEENRPEEIPTIEPEVAPTPITEPVVAGEVTQLGRISPDTFKGRNIFEMTPEELDVAAKQALKEEKDVDTEVLGEELGARYDKLLKTADSSNIDRADVAQAEIDKIEATLTNEQLDRLSGIGEAGASAEELADLRNQLNDIDIESEQEMGESLKFIMTKLPSHTDFSKMTNVEKTSVAVLRNANNLAKELGFDTARVTNIAIKASARRFSPSDAEFMLRNIKQL
ncbi:hypothetical protein LCGC14_2846230, partial [marine sediment metagenome]